MHACRVCIRRAIKGANAIIVAGRGQTQVHTLLLTVVFLCPVHALLRPAQESSREVADITIRVSVMMFDRHTVLPCSAAGNGLHKCMDNMHPAQRKHCMPGRLLLRSRQPTRAAAGIAFIALTAARLAQQELPLSPWNTMRCVCACAGGAVH